MTSDGSGAAGAPADPLEDLRRRIGELGLAAKTAKERAPQPEPEARPGALDIGDEEKVARSVCLRLLADSARPRAGLEQALRRRGISAEVAAKVLDRYTELGLIDDQAYAEAYVRSRHRARALGRRALQAELSSKGIDDEIIIDAVAAVNSDDERRRATELITRRITAAMVAGEEAARRRLLGLLARRGYPADMAIQLVDAAILDQQGCRGHSGRILDGG